MLEADQSLPLREYSRNASEPDKCLASTPAPLYSNHEVRSMVEATQAYLPENSPECLLEGIVDRAG